ncbi:hypothetical protein H5410_042775 [Solanum commersonii]|uniref:Uncharacterized protein n=1 Tax=Solanum commersonii TaxID=4109 RepID=A0A9J5XWM0_SOLCO|nr:hypothetical protein H5410_042775 [Solanum commersonii]
MDNPYHYNQFQRILDRDIVGESSGNKLSASANMRGKIVTSHMLLRRIFFPFNTQPISHPVFLDNFTNTTDDVVPATSLVNTDSSAVEPMEHPISPRDVRHSTRPRKLPSWMNDFITNVATASTPYPLSHTLSYSNLSTQYQSNYRTQDSS